MSVALLGQLTVDRKVDKMARSRAGLMIANLAVKLVAW